MRLLLVTLLTVASHASFLQATEPLFKFTFGGKLGTIPLEINKMSKNIKNIGGIKINSWTLSPNFSSFVKDKKSNFIETKLEEKLFIKINLKF